MLGRCKLGNKPTLFLIEQLVVITIFAVFAAVCIKILVISYLMTVDAVDTRSALFVAESAAEGHKFFAGDKEDIAILLGGNAWEGGVSVYFDRSWEPSIEAYASFVLRLNRREDEKESTVIFSDIIVTRIDTGDELVSITTAVRGNVR